MWIAKPLSIEDFKAEMKFLRAFVPDLNVWQGLARWINSFAEENQKVVFSEILQECVKESMLNEGENV